MGAFLYMEQMARSYAQNRIRELRKSKGMSLEALGLAMPSQLTPSTVAKLETGQMALSLDYIQEAAAVLGVSPADIVVANATGVRMLPVIGTIACGNWREAIAESGEYVPVPSGLVGVSLFALRPVGDSMDMIVAEDGFIVVDPDQRELIDRKVYVVMNGESEATFKRFRADPPRLEPVSSNPVHNDIVLGEHPFVVVGRVIYAGLML